MANPTQNRTEPPREWQDDVFAHMVDRDPIAFAELCEAALPHLIAELEAGYPQEDLHSIQTTVHDLLIHLQQQPHQYNPAKASLFSFLRMAARGDMKNAIEKRVRQGRHLQPLDDSDVELSHSVRNIEQYDDPFEWLNQYTKSSPQEIVNLIREELDDLELLVAEMMYVEGVRETPRFAEVMNITHLDEFNQAREVKRMKDRIAKRLARLVDRIKGDDN